MIDPSRSDVSLLLRATYGTDQADALVASMIQIALQEVQRGASIGTHLEAWAHFQARLRQPRVQWELVDDVFTPEVPDDGLAYSFIVPENASLTSQAPVALMARELLDPDSSNWPGASELGRTHTYGRIGAHPVELLVCEEDGAVSGHALFQCLCDGGGQRTLGRFGTRYIVPVIGAPEANIADPEGIAYWADAWSTSIRCAPVSVLVRFQRGDPARAHELERSLLTLGVPCCRAGDALGAEHLTYLHSLRARDGSHRMSEVPLHQVELWAKSEIRLPTERWTLLEELVSLDA